MSQKKNEEKTTTQATTQGKPDSEDLEVKPTQKYMLFKKRNTTGIIRKSRGGDKKHLCMTIISLKPAAH